MERRVRRLFDSAPMSVPRKGADVPAVYALRAVQSLTFGEMNPCGERRNELSIERLTQ
jgi:hypothetical protein